MPAPFLHDLSFDIISPTYSYDEPLCVIIFNKFGEVLLRYHDGKSAVAVVLVSEWWVYPFPFFYGKGKLRVNVTTKRWTDQFKHLVKMVNETHGDKTIQEVIELFKEDTKECKSYPRPRY